MKFARALIASVSSVGYLTAKEVADYFAFKEHPRPTSIIISTLLTDIALFGLSTRAYNYFFDQARCFGSISSPLSLTHRRSHIHFSSLSLEMRNEARECEEVQLRQQ